MKCKVDPVDAIMAIFIGLFIFLCMVVVGKSEGRVQYDPPCSLEYQLTILEKRRCDKESS